MKEEDKDLSYWKANAKECYMITPIGVLRYITELEKAVKNNGVSHGVNERTLGINSCAALIKSMPTDQAIQIMKSDITGQPQTTIIDGELVVAYIR